MGQFAILILSCLAFVFAGMVLVPQAMKYYLLWKKAPEKVSNFGLATTLFASSFFIFAGIFIHFLTPFLRFAER